MEVEMRMPDLATTDSAVTVVRWLVEVGQAVRRGEPLVEIETDKALMEVESIVSGTLKVQSAVPDEQVQVGQVIAVFAVEGEVGAPRVSPPEAPPALPEQGGPEPLPERPAAPPPRQAGSFFARNRQAARGATPDPPDKPAP